MQPLPADIDLESLPGPKRGVSPAIYVRDEIVYSPSGKNFALAYSITEASMNNEIGCVLWGRVCVGKTVGMENPKQIHATCWFSPWARWLDDETFVFKAQQYDGRRTHLPLIAIRLDEGFAVLPATSNGESRPADVFAVPHKFQPVTVGAMLRAINADL